ncbi:MAG: alpha-L-arabinofuranosidase C-terminal domain-containing protein [Phycisphaerae bacterium]|nr:alpha-L-arabinofuranosidase C-terminal domain-containing protein [Phycisphaerae bacterium]
MKALVRATGGLLGRASEQLLSNNIEAYENTIPAMLSDRLRNPKFAGPENPQTGLAAEWEPDGNGMAGFSCRLVPGMYLSGREAQLVHNYTQHNVCGILQTGVHVRDGEEFEVEMWARVQHRPVKVAVELRAPGCPAVAASRGEMTFDLAHWHRRSCRIKAPAGCGVPWFQISVPGDSRLVIDQVHLRPAGQAHASPEMLDAFGQFPCPSLRFPGGCVSCAYHWEHGTGPVHLRPVCDDPVFKYKLHYDFGTDEYLELCAAKNIRPFITLNTSTATPEDAAAWAAYVRDWYRSRGLGVPAAYFMVGNENYWIHEIGHMTDEMYVAQLREFVPPVRAAYPESRILAIGEFSSGGLRDGSGTPWRETIMAKAADLFDVLVVTRYSHSRGADSLPLAQGMESLANSLADKEADLQRQAQSIRDAKLGRTMGIVEWNYWTRAHHADHAGFYEPNDIRHCLYAAGYLNAFCRLGDILEVANFYSLVNTMGMIHVHDGRVQLSDLVKVFNLYADALPGEVLELAVDGPQLTEKRKAVDANFVRKGDATFGFLVNLSATDAADVSLAGLGPIRAARGLTAKAVLTPVAEFQPVVTGAAVALPPMSLVRVTCAV